MTPSTRKANKAAEEEDDDDDSEDLSNACVFRCPECALDINSAQVCDIVMKSRHDMRRLQEETIF